MLIGLFCKYTLLAQPERKNEPLRVCENAACLLSCAVKGHCSHTLCFNANEKAVNYVLQFTKSLKHLNSYFTEVGFLKWWFVFAQVGREESDFWLDGCMDEWGGLSTLDSSHSSHVFLFEFSTTWSANPRLYWVGYISYPPPGGSKLFFFYWLMLTSSKLILCWKQIQCLLLISLILFACSLFPGLFVGHYIECSH